MPRENCQKIKLLKLMEMLQRESDEDTPLTTNTIIDKLADLGITCDRRTVTTDVETLQEFGYPIKVKQVGHEKGYYTSVKGFAIPELKILIDAVQAAGFIPQKMTDELVEKLAWLGGSSHRELIRENVVCFNTAKHTNDNVFRNVAVLEEALIRKRRASFYYFDRDERGKKVYRKGRTRYVTDPVALIFNDDRYYLMSYSTKYDNITNYRVDRMEGVVLEKELVNEKAILKDTEIASYTEQVFQMYGGPLRDVTVQFPRNLMGAVQDKFGEDAPIVPVGDDQCVASIQVQISPTFWGWLFQFAGEMTIVSPRDLSQEYMDRAIAVVRR